MSLQKLARELVVISQECARQNSPVEASAMAFAQSKCTHATLDALINVLIARGWLTKESLNDESLNTFKKEIEQIRGPSIILPKGAH